MHRSIYNLNILPPTPLPSRAYHGHLTPSLPTGVGHLTLKTSTGVRNLIPSRGRWVTDRACGHHEASEVRMQMESEVKC